MAHKPKPWDEPKSPKKKWIPLRDIGDPLQRSLTARMRQVKNVTALAREMVRLSGGDPGDDDQMKSKRRHLNKWRSGSNPDAKLTSITLAAKALGEDPLAILSYGRVGASLGRIGEASEE